MEEFDDFNDDAPDTGLKAGKEEYRFLAGHISDDHEVNDRCVAFAEELVGKYIANCLENPDDKTNTASNALIERIEGLIKQVKNAKLIGDKSVVEGLSGTVEKEES